MRAGFQRDIGGCATRGLTRHVQCDGFRVRPPSGLSPATPNHAPVADDHTTDGRVGPTLPHTTPTQCKRMGHVAPIVRDHFSA